MSYCEQSNCGYYWKEEGEDFPCCHFEGRWTPPCEEEDGDEYEEEEKMLIAKCPYCKTDLEIDESYDFYMEYGYAIDRVTGHCPLCGKKFQWEEFYQYYSCENLREVN